MAAPRSGSSSSQILRFFGAKFCSKLKVLQACPEVWSLSFGVWGLRIGGGLVLEVDAHVGDLVCACLNGSQAVLFIGHYPGPPAKNSDDELVG